MTTINVFTAKACAAPLLEAAKLYEAKAGVSIHVDMCSRHCANANAEEATGPGGDDFLQEIADAGIYDCAISGAEYLLDDGEVRGIIAKGVRRFIALRRSALLVSKANPKGIARLEDMARPGVRVAVSVLDCLKSVWEDVTARAGLLDAVRRNISFYANGCISIIEAIAQDKVDAAFGWSAFGHLDDRIATIPLPDAVSISRATSIGMLKLVKNPRPAEAFMDFLTTPEARDIYRRFGWV